ncbi:MAG: ATP-dependent DNA helicase RecG [Bacilli bacterium]|nr:ATP-dependent DNA helicase RecG [Bacilli bacterium]
MILADVKGIGPKSEKVLNKMGIFTPDDLISFFPFRYEVIERTDIFNLRDGDKIIIDGVLEAVPTIFFFGRKDKMNFKLSTKTKMFNVSIFNRGFLKSKLLVGTKISVIGKYDQKYNLIVASDLKFGLLPDVPVIEPVYHTVSGISGKQIETFINNLFFQDYKIIDYVPSEYVSKYHFISKRQSLENVHFPKNLKELHLASQRLKYEEAFKFMFKMNYLKMNTKNNDGLVRNVDFEKVEEFIKTLPFELTADQKKAVDNIYEDLVSLKRMNRLIQGDVGSGKTIVAIISLFINYLSGYQGALMAPTEILAVQHFHNIEKLFDKYGIRITLLTGNTKAKEKKEIYEKLENHEYDIVIGTHALITEKVKYASLGLVITDEQHRFGVNQRSNLKNKGKKPDILYMSATPIPRTYALTLYGDMDVSSIKTVPNGRKEIITKIKRESEIKDVLTMMLTEIKNNHQIYVVAPLIEESDKSNLTDIENLYKNLERALGKVCKLGLLHGKMSNKEKSEVMESFKNNETQILVSTTVIEVGVDVKNATMMVIFDAFQFGLSALHQLRGRVGRNDLQSYCILVSEREVERLKILEETNDGFKVSEEDFKLRGSGDIFGVRQSGDMAFKILNIKNDFNILRLAKEDSEEFLKSKEIGYFSNLIQEMEDVL